MKSAVAVEHETAVTVCLTRGAASAVEHEAAVAVEHKASLRCVLL